MTGERRRILCCIAEKGNFLHARRENNKTFIQVMGCPETDNLACAVNKDRFRQKRSLLQRLKEIGLRNFKDGLGTVPAMFLIGMLAGGAGNIMRGRLYRAGGAVVALMGLVYVYRGLAFYAGL